MGRLDHEEIIGGLITSLRRANPGIDQISGPGGNHNTRTPEQQREADLQHLGQLDGLLLALNAMRHASAVEGVRRAPGGLSLFPRFEFDATPTLGYGSLRVHAGGTVHDLTGPLDPAATTWAVRQPDDAGPTIMIRVQFAENIPLPPGLTNPETP